MYVVLGLCLAVFASSALEVSEETTIRKVRSYLTVRDPRGALKEIGHGLLLYPNSLTLKSLKVSSLGYLGKSKEALQEWQRLYQLDPSILSRRDLLEDVSWAFLKEGLRSEQKGVRCAALIGALLTQDAKALTFLIDGLRDRDASIRWVALQMAPHYRDLLVQQEVFRLLEEETVWWVRLGVIQALGELQARDAGPKLCQILESGEALAEEKQAAIEAFIKIDRASVSWQGAKLIQSDRFGLRALGCVLLALDEDQTNISKLSELALDPHPKVQMQALLAIGSKCAEQGSWPFSATKLRLLMEGADPYVRIVGAWLASLNLESWGLDLLKSYTYDTISAHRYFAAAAIGALGDRSIKLAEQIFQDHEDPFVVINVALGLIGQRVKVQEASQAIARILKEEHSLWMWDETTPLLWPMVVPGVVQGRARTVRDPKMADQMTRLRMIALLADLGYPEATSLLQHILQQGQWVVSGLAASILLQKGDDNHAMDLLRGLLEDPDPKIRLEAGLVLAFVAHDEKVIPYLMQLYEGLSQWDHKLTLLESLGKISNTSSSLFLIQAMQEPFEILRVAAA